jgi:hypothetical protein
MEEVGALRVSLGLNSIDFTQGMQNANRKIQALNSEFKAVSTGAGKFDQSLESLRVKSDVLTRTFQTHQQKVAELRRQYEQSKAVKGEDAAETERLSTAYNRAVTAMNRTESQLRQVNGQIQEQTNEFKQLENSVNASVSDISRQLRVLDSGYAAATTGAHDLGNSVEGLQQREEHLTQSMRLQQRSVSDLSRLHQESARRTGEDSAATQELAIRLNRATQEMRQTESQLNDTTSELQRQSSAWNRLSDRSIAAGNRMQSVGGQMQSVGSEITQTFGTAFLAIGAGLGVSAKKAMDFESQMSAVKSVLAPDEVNQFGGALENLAIKLGAETKYSALEAAQGIEELIKAGVKTTDIINGGLDGALSLATAGGLELADAAEIASTALNAFKDDNLTVMRAADLLAGAANASATSVGELKFGLSSVGAVASGVGLSFKDTTTALAVFAQNGLKGQDAGTSLKTMLMNLTPKTKAQTDAFDSLNLGTSNAAAGYKYLKDHGITPLSSTVTDVNEELHKLSERQAGAGASASKVADKYAKLAKQSGFASSAFYDQNGNLKSMSEISGILQKSLSGLNSEQRQSTLYTMFGSDAIRAANILYKEGAIGITTMADSMEKIKSADVAAQKLDNVKGRIEQLKGAVETASISIGQGLLPTIDKIVAGVQNMTDGFNALSPELQQTIVKTALVGAGVTGLVAAFGVTLAVTGAAITGFGALTTAFGVATGSAGVLGGAIAVLTGPVGLIVGGLALATAAVFAYQHSQEKAAEVNLDHAKSMIEQQQSLENLTSKYEALRETNTLTNEQLLRFRDIQGDLKTEKTAESIAKLKDEAEKLREKSGLSNDQLNEMLSLNDQLIEKVPTAGQAISDQGSAILSNTDELHNANDALRENIALELEIQKTKAEAKMDENIRNQIEAMKELNGVIKDLNSSKIEGAAKEYQLEQLKKQQQDAYAAGQNAIADGMNNGIRLLEFQINQQDEKVGKVASEVQEKQKSLDKTTEEITKTQALFDEMINVQLAQAGINGKGQEGLNQLDKAISKTQSRVNELNHVKEEQDGLNGKQQKELDHLNEALGKYRDTKGEIKNIQGEQDTVNRKIEVGKGKAGEMSDVLSQSEVKNIKFSGDGYHEAKVISNEAGKDANKVVSVTDHGKANSIQKEAEKSASKGIQLFLKNHLMDLLPPSVSIPVRLLGKLKGMFAEGTRNAPGGLSLVGEEGPELIHLPQGAKVVPNGDTEAILRNWNIPMLASGGVALSSGMAMVGEKGRELMDLRGATTRSLSQSNNNPVSNSPTSIELFLNIDGREFARATVDNISDLLHGKATANMITNGVR